MASVGLPRLCVNTGEWITLSFPHLVPNAYQVGVWPGKAMRHKQLTNVS